MPLKREAVDREQVSFYIYAACCTVPVIRARSTGPSLAWAIHDAGNMWTRHHPEVLYNIIENISSKYKIVWYDYNHDYNNSIPYKIYTIRKCCRVAVLACLPAAVVTKIAGGSSSEPTSLDCANISVREKKPLLPPRHLSPPPLHPVLPSN